MGMGFNDPFNSSKVMEDFESLATLNFYGFCMRILIRLINKTEPNCSSAHSNAAVFYYFMLYHHATFTTS